MSKKVQNQSESSKAVMASVNVEGLFADLYTKGETKLSDHATPIVEQAKPEKAVKKSSKRASKKAVKESGLKFIDYSEKAFAVVGDTKSIKAKLMVLGGKFNPKLSCGAGWIFSKKRESQVRLALAI